MYSPTFVTSLMDASESACLGIERVLVISSRTHDIAHEQQYAQLVHGAEPLYPRVHVFRMQAVITQT